MSTSSFPSGDSSSPESEILNSITTMSNDIEQAVLNLEPKVRELNRHITAIFGRCPSQVNGEWVSIGIDADGHAHYEFSPIDPAFALVLVSRLAEIIQIIDDNELSFVSSKKYESDLGPEIVGNSALLHFVPSTHIRKVR